jgi:uncharacterized repeat protein (TIGR04076 family)
MKRTYKEPYQFIIQVTKVTDDEPKNCRLGFESGDLFTCEYSVPNEFCPKAITSIYPYMEAIRAGGDLRELGGQDPSSKLILCPDGEVSF